MIIESSDQIPRATLLNRFPVPRNFGVAPGSRFNRGKTWPAPSGAVRVKSFEIYRYAPDSGENPRLDTFEVGDAGRGHYGSGFTTGWECSISRSAAPPNHAARTDILMLIAKVSAPY